MIKFENGELIERLLSLADCDTRAGEPLGKVMREAAAALSADGAARHAVMIELRRLQRNMRAADLNAEALAEIKATVDGKSDQSVKDIIYGLIAEIQALPK